MVLAHQYKHYRWCCMDIQGISRQYFLASISASEKATFAARQAYTRDRSIFVALRELGLRASELIKATMGAFHCLTDPKDGKTYWVMVVREETAKGRKERTVPVTKTVMAALGSYREAFGMDALPAPIETGSLILSPRTDRGAIAIGGKPIRDVESRRFFQAWLPVTTRHGLYYIVKGRLTRTADALEHAGDIAGSAHLREASTHWLRHTFAKSALLTGQDIRRSPRSSATGIWPRPWSIPSKTHWT